MTDFITLKISRSVHMALLDIVMEHMRCKDHTEVFINCSTSNAEETTIGEVLRAISADENELPFMSIQDWRYDANTQIWEYLKGPGSVMMNRRPGPDGLKWGGVAFWRGKTLDRFDDAERGMRAVVEAFETEKLDPKLSGPAEGNENEPES